LKCFKAVIERERALADELSDLLVLLLELLKFELLDDSLYLLVKFVIKVFILEGSLVQLLVQASLLDGSVGHVIQLGKLHIVYRALSLSQDLGQSR
jgi:hypothetical protein